MNTYAEATTGNNVSNAGADLTRSPCGFWWMCEWVKATLLFIAALFAFVVHDEARAQAIAPQWSCTILNTYHTGSGAIESPSACGKEAFAQASPNYPLDTDGGPDGGNCGTPPTTAGQGCSGGEILCNQYSQCFQGYLSFTMTATGPNASSKDAGCPSCKDGRVGEPIVLSIGNKILKETDFLGSSESPLRFERFYNSTSVAASAQSFGQNWTHTYGASVTALSPTTASVARSDGKAFIFTLSGSTWVSDADVSDKLVQLTNGTTVTGWQYTNASDDSLETYDAYGNLSSIVYRNGKSVVLSYVTGGEAQTFPAPLLSATDSFGNTLAFNTTSATSRTMTDPKGELYTYAMGPILQISSVTYPDTNIKTYLYNESAYTGGQSLPYALTGIMDENNSRYDSTLYGSSGLATQTALAGGVNQYTLTNTLDANGRVQSVSMTDPLGAIRGRSFTSLVGRNRLSSVAQPSASGQTSGNKSIAFDINGNTASSTDLDGNVTCSSYDLTRNLETARLDGIAPGTSCPSNIATYTAAAPQRKFLTQYHAVWHLPITQSEPRKITTLTYNGDGGVYCAPTGAQVGGHPIGVLCSRSEQGTTDATGTSGFSATATGSARVWAFTYNSFGQVLTANGPRTDVTDVTTYTYNSCSTGAQCGQVHTIQDAAGHITTFLTYDGNGQPLTFQDANGVITTITYDARQRVKSRKVGTETTGYSYYATGLLQTVTQPDSSTLTYTYDSAHRLTQITDGLGNAVKYTLDAAGNRTAEKSYDASNNQRRSHTRVFNALGSTYQDLLAAGTSAVTTTYGYDANGNKTSEAGPYSRNSSYSYDVLNRLHNITDPASGVTALGYLASEELDYVIDPKGFLTTYHRDPFWALSQLTSPETNNTYYTYDTAGNLATTTDARNAGAVYSYDALNRETKVVYSDQSINYGYDSGTNGLGRLTSASDANHSMSWSYDTLGRVSGKSQVVAGVTKSIGYSFTNGDLITLVTPSGQNVVYSYTNHRISSITINGTTLLSSVTYDPFGPVSGWTWGNGTTVTRSYDQDGNPQQIVTAGVTNGYTIDNASRVTGLSDSGASANSFIFGYDTLDRVTSGTSSAITRGYGYDANSNQSSSTGTVAFTDTLSTTSNRLNSTSGAVARTYGYDAAGNTTSFTGSTFGYNQRGRLSSVVTSTNSVTNTYNALGQLINSSSNGTPRLYFYDENGHLLGEYNGDGSLIQETVWMGDLPVATLQPNAGVTTTYYVHTDHLGTPRKVTRPSDNTLLWRWDPDTYGSVNPVKTGLTGYSLRFPGQFVLLGASGIYYNYFRTYDNVTGRYLESDPIGLVGGINTYAYVGGNPVSNYDPLGLTQCDIDTARQIAVDANLLLDDKTPLQFPPEYASNSFSDPLERALTYYQQGTILSDYYQQQLTDAQAAELLDTIIHESIHYTLPPTDPRTVDKSGKGYPYDQAKKLTTPR